MKQLSAGWYAANLDKVATLAEEATWQSQNPAALFVLSRILRLVEMHWDIDLQGEQAFATQEAAEAIESDVQPAITAFLDTADARELSAAEQVDHMNAMVTAYLKWRTRDLDKPT